MAREHASDETVELMASVIFDEKELCGLMGAKLSAAELRERIDMLGMPVDAYADGKFSLDITPNRIDMLSVEGMARALASFTGTTPGLRKYSAEPSGMRLEIDRSVRGARPYIVMAHAKGVNLNEELLLSLINVQEKIHDTFGRKRRKVSIGLHDADKVKAPFTYKAVKEFTFTPLDSERPMTIAQILKEHPKGVDYAHLVQPGKYPLLLDSNAEVLAFPPIINGTITMLTPQTRNLLMDVTGTSPRAIMDALNVLCCMLADRGAKLHSIETTDGVTPNLSPRTMKFDYKKCNRLLGLSVS
ncbi:Phenylalanine--tRNA ligase beta subunit [Candidatus Burarchaeum australiense]|nr:Phenylalanine--tRNA ligase beta subunit [Candidatus Burarchaeum australiense]